jgi:hypothetical protein
MKDALHEGVKKFKISIHPKLSAVLDGVIGVVFIWTFNHLPDIGWLIVLWFFLRCIWWVFLMRITYYTGVIKRVDHLRSLLLFHLGATATLLFIDWTYWHAWSGIFIGAPSISFWLLPSFNSDLSFIGKPHQRWSLMLNALGIAGLWSGVAAVVAFYSGWLWFAAWFFAACITGVVSMSWWRYYGMPSRDISVWLGTLATIMIPISAVILLWPVGFLISGIGCAWVWYLVWQIGRFYFSPDGIDWKKQFRFIVISIFLLMGLFGGLAAWR